MSSRGGRAHEDYGESMEENNTRMSGSWPRRGNRSNRMAKAKFKYCTNLNVREGQPRDRHVGLYSPDCTVTYTPLSRSPPHNAPETDFESGMVGGIDGLAKLYMKEKMPDRDSNQRSSNRNLDARSRSPIFPNVEDREVFEINLGQSSRYQEGDSYHGELFRPLEWEEIDHSPSPTPRQQFRGSPDVPQGDSWEDRRDRRSRREKSEINRSNKRDLIERGNRGRGNWHEKQEYCREDWPEGKDGSGDRWAERLDPTGGDHSNCAWLTRRASKSLKDNWHEMTDRDNPKDDMLKRRDDTKRKRKDADNTKYERNRRTDSNNTNIGWVERRDGDSSKDKWLENRDRASSIDNLLERRGHNRSINSWLEKRDDDSLKDILLGSIDRGSSKDNLLERRDLISSKENWQKRDCGSSKDNMLERRDHNSSIDNLLERRGYNRSIDSWPEKRDHNSLKDFLLESIDRGSSKDNWLEKRDCGSSKDNMLERRDHDSSMDNLLDRRGHNRPIDSWPEKRDHERLKDNWLGRRDWDSSKDDWVERRNYEISKNDWPVRRDTESLKDNWVENREIGSPKGDWSERRDCPRNSRPETSGSRKDEWLVRHDNVKETLSGRKEEIFNVLDRFVRGESPRGGNFYVGASPSVTNWPGRSDKPMDDFPVITRASHLFDAERNLSDKKMQNKVYPPPAEIYDYTRIPLVPPPPPPPILSLTPPILSNTTDYSKPLPFKPSVVYDVESVKQSMQLLEKLKKKQEILSKCELKIGELYRSRTKLSNEPSSFIPSVQRIIQLNCNESPVVFTHQALSFNCIKKKIYELEDSQFNANPKGTDCTDTYESMGPTDRKGAFNIFQHSIEDLKSSDNVVDQFGSVDYPVLTVEERSPSHLSSIDMLHQKPDPPVRPLSPDYRTPLPANPFVDMACRILQGPSLPIQSSSQVIKEPQPAQPNLDFDYSHQPHSRGSGWPIYKTPVEMVPQTTSHSVKIPPPPAINAPTIEPVSTQSRDYHRPNRSLITLNLLPRDNVFQASSCVAPYNNASRNDSVYSSPQADSAYAYKVEEFLAKIQGETKKTEKCPKSIKDYSVVLSDDDDVIYVGESKNSPTRNRRSNLSSSRRSEKIDYGNRKERISEQPTRHERKRQFPGFHSSSRISETNDDGNRAESISEQPLRHERKRQFPDLHLSSRRSEKIDGGNKTEKISEQPSRHEMKSQFTEMPSSSRRSETNDDGNRAESISEQLLGHERKIHIPELHLSSRRSEKIDDGNKTEKISELPSRDEIKSQFPELPSSTQRSELNDEENRKEGISGQPSRHEIKSQLPEFSSSCRKSEKNDDANKPEEKSEQPSSHERKRQFTELGDEPPGTSPLINLPLPSVTSPKRSRLEKAQRNIRPGKRHKLLQILPKLTAPQSSNLTLIVGKQNHKTEKNIEKKIEKKVEKMMEKKTERNKDQQFLLDPTKPNLIVVGVGSTFCKSNKNSTNNSPPIDKSNISIPDVNKTYINANISISTFDPSNEGNKKKKDEKDSPICSLTQGELNESKTSVTPNKSTDINTKVIGDIAHISQDTSEEKITPSSVSSNSKAASGLSEEKNPLSCASFNLAAAQGSSEEIKPPGCATSNVAVVPRSSEEKKTNCKQDEGAATAGEINKQYGNEGSKVSDFENIFKEKNEIAMTIQNIQTNDERLQKVFNNTVRNKTINKSLCIKNGMLCLNNEALGIRIVASTIEEKIIYYLHCLFQHRNDSLTTVLKNYFTPIKELGEKMKSALKSCDYCLKRPVSSSNDDRQCSKEPVSKKNTNSVEERSVEHSLHPTTDLEESTSVSKDASDKTIKDPMSLVKEIQSSSKQVNDIISHLDQDENKSLYFLKNNLLLKRCHIGSKTLLKILIPEDKIEEVIMVAHEVFSIHGNMDSVLSILEKQFSPMLGLEEYIKKAIATCSQCSNAKSN